MDIDEMIDIDYKKLAEALEGVRAENNDKINSLLLRFFNTAWTNVLEPGILANLPEFEELKDEEPVPIRWWVSILRKFHPIREVEDFGILLIRKEGRVWAIDYGKDYLELGQMAAVIQGRTPLK